MPGCGRAAIKGGGPHLDLLRRLAHWLMKEPDLEEEALRASAPGRDIRVERQTMADTREPVTVTAPSGESATLTLKQAEPGLWRGTLRHRRAGPVARQRRQADGARQCRPANPREFQDVVSTTERLAGLAAETRGSVRRIAGSNGLSLPRVASVASGGSFAGEGWIGFKEPHVSVVRGVSVLPLFGGLLGLALLLGFLSLTWAREGR